jgi:hypothetical protein
VLEIFFLADGKIFFLADGKIFFLADGKIFFLADGKIFFLAVCVGDIGVIGEVLSKSLPRLTLGEWEPFLVQIVVFPYN